MNYVLISFLPILVGCGCNNNSRKKKKKNKTKIIRFQRKLITQIYVILMNTRKDIYQVMN